MIGEIDDTLDIVLFDIKENPGAYIKDLFSFFSCGVGAAFCGHGELPLTRWLKEWYVSL